MTASATPAPALTMTPAVRSVPILSSPSPAASVTAPPPATALPPATAFPPATASPPSPSPAPTASPEPSPAPSAKSRHHVEPTPPPGPTPVPTPAAVIPAPDSKYIDSYLLLRPGADSTQGLTLRLRGDGLATLRTEFPGYTQTAAGSSVTPVDELGTWIERNGYAYVHLTQRQNAPVPNASLPNVPAPSASAPTASPTPPPQPESVMLAFSLKRCSLKLVGDPGHVFGTKGLQFTKHHCP
ncbi:MAG: hypothetical protein ACLPSH_22035 [Vulcanimicrobiaceae bacterium]